MHYIKYHLLFITILLLIQFYAFKDSIPNKGDTITGTVISDKSPMAMVSVYERDSANQIVSIGITDLKGKFSFDLKNPDDKIWISYPGFDTVIIPIDRLQYDIELKENVRQDSYDTFDYPKGLITPLKETNTENNMK